MLRSRFAPRPVGALAALAACQAPLVTAPGSDDDLPEIPDDDVPAGDDDDDDDDGSAGLALDAVAPNYGTAGHRVTLTGTFPDDTTVRLGIRAADVVERRPDQLIVEVPDLGGDDVPTLEVTARGASAGLPFRYFASAAGRTGAFGSVSTVVYYGDYWADTVVDDGSVDLYFSHPTDHDWVTLLYAAEPETCYVGYAYAGDVDVYAPGLDEVRLTDGGAELVLVPDPDYPANYEIADVPIAAGAAYDLAPTAGSPAWPVLEVPGLAGVVPEPFAVTIPPIDGAAPPPVGPEIGLQWGPPYTGDLVLVVLERYRTDADGITTSEEVVTCWLDDDGEAGLPDLWDDWDTDTDGVYLAVGRANRPAAVLPHNDGASEVLGIMWSAGYLDAE